MSRLNKDFAFRQGLGAGGGATSQTNEPKKSGSKKSGYFVRGGVQKSNVDSEVHYEEVTKSHYETEKGEPDPKKR